MVRLSDLLRLVLPASHDAADRRPAFRHGNIIAFCFAALLIVIAVAIAHDDAPELWIVPPAVTAEGEPVIDDGQIWLRDYSNVKHAIFMVGGLSRASEMGHEDYRPELAGDPMAERGRLWVRLMEQVDAVFADGGVLSPYLVLRDREWEAARQPRIANYPDAVYAYHMHHRAGRWRDHGLFDELTETSIMYQSNAGRYLLDELYHAGRFYHGPEHERTDLASMAYGLAGIHGHAYAWVRWNKPGAADDMGRVPEGRLARFLGYGIEELIEVCREIADVLEQHWQVERSAWDFGDGAVYRLSELGALLRGTKGVYEMLYAFGDNGDREQAERLFRQTSEALSALLSSEQTIRDWGMPERVEFTDAGVVPASGEVDTAEFWALVTHLTGGFALVREREGTARFFERLEPDVLEDVGALTDRLLLGALEHQITDGHVAARLDFETGEAVDNDRTAAAISRFVTAAGNAYRQGEVFERAQDWADMPAEVRDRSRALYDTLLAHAALLEDAFLVEMHSDTHMHDHANHHHVHDHEVHWLGRLHPPSVHFPIGLLLAALVAEILFAATGKPRFAAASWFCAWAGVITAWIAAVLGWLFGGFDVAADDWLFATHRWLGTATAAWTLILVWTLLRNRADDFASPRTFYRIALTLAALIVGATGFFGGVLVWGWEHYTLR